VVTRTLRWTAGQGAALIFGGSESLDALSAALINGTASHALDFDDCSNTLGGHPSAPILPALWTLATGVSGKAFIAAYAAGFETECKLARAVNFHHYEKGWHPTATLGVFGSAAACARLLALGDEHLRRNDFDGAIHLYELGDADQERWARVIDLLTARPDQERRAIALAERYLVGEAPKVERRLAAAI
jgi:hypothetical protein